MLNSIESGFGNSREGFDAVSEEEKIKRFSAIQSLFKEQGKAETPGEKSRARFFEFVQKAPDFAQKLGEDKDSLRHRKNACEIVKSALNYFLEVQKNVATGSKDSSAQINLESSINRAAMDRVPNAESLVDTKTKQLDVDELSRQFEQSFNDFYYNGVRVTGKSAGDMAPEEGEMMAGDLKEILTHVNQYR